MTFGLHRGDQVPLEGGSLDARGPAQRPRRVNRVVPAADVAHVVTARLDAGTEPAAAPTVTEPIAPATEPLSAVSPVAGPAAPPAPAALPVPPASRRPGGPGPRRIRPLQSRGASRDPLSLLDRYRNLALASDASAAVVAGLVAVAVRFGLHWPPAYVLVTALLPASWIVMVALQRGYEGRFLGNGPEEYRRATIAAMALFTLMAVTAYVLRRDVSRTYVLLAVALLLVLSLLGRHALRTWTYRLRVAGHGLQRVLVVGRADAAVAVIDKLRQEPQHGLHAVAACVPLAAGLQVSHVGGIPVVGDVDTIVEAVDAVGAHVVAVVSHPDLAGASLRRLSWALEERGVELVVSPGIVEVAGPRLSIRPVAGLSLLHLERPTLGGARWVLKTVFDRVLAALLLVVASPLIAVIAVLVRMTSPGPVLFRQERIGVDGARFTMLKFRSMVEDAEQRRRHLAGLDQGNGVLFKVHADPRVTRVGGWLRRFSLDELPQLVNVLRGDMSLVGPRPPLPEEVAAYDDVAVRRLRVRPGMTGLWQVSGRSDLSWEESLRLDLRYVDNWSMALDLSILWRTWRAVVRGAGAY
jgi:exopolysaccharide biosynthesis polyprenyl glycosylphosphotransferase